MQLVITKERLNHQEMLQSLLRSASGLQSLALFFASSGYFFSAALQFGMPCAIHNDDEVKKFIRLIIITATASTLALLYFFADARYASFFPHCPFHSITGLLCPGCGSQRAFSAILHGQLLQAANYNLLFVLATPLILYSALVAVLNTFRTKQLTQSLFYSPLFTKVLLGVVLVFWIVRNIPVYPFKLLAPHVV
jgi:hypothetical protein